MRSKFLLRTAMLFAGVIAQQTSPRPTAKPEPPPRDPNDPPKLSPAGPKTHTIDVGEDGYSIRPNRTVGKVGDMLEWQFHSGEHWIIRGTLDYPCIPREYILEEAAGFSSGPMKVDDEDDEKPVFRARINDTDTILFYSGGDGDCVDHRMMGSVNPQRNINLINYKARANDVEYQLRPGDPWPEDEKLPSTTVPNISTATGDVTEKETPAPPAEEDNNSEEEEGLSTGAIAGLAVGGAVALAIFGLAIFYCGRRGGVKILFTNERPESPSEERGQRYATPATVEAPFRPPRTPNTENWRPLLDNRGNLVPRAEIPQAPMYQKSVSALSPYNLRERGQGYLSADDATPPPQERRHIAPYSDLTPETARTGRPPWTDAQYSRASAAPVELPASSDPGNSPLPQYRAGDGQDRFQSRKFSWTGTREDALFRTSEI